MVTESIKFASAFSNRSKRPSMYVSMSSATPEKTDAWEDSLFRKVVRDSSLVEQGLLEVKLPREKSGSARRSLIGQIGVKLEFKPEAK